MTDTPRDPLAALRATVETMTYAEGAPSDLSAESIFESEGFDWCKKRVLLALDAALDAARPTDDALRAAILALRAEHPIYRDRVLYTSGFNEARNRAAALAAAPQCLTQAGGTMKRADHD